MDSRTVLSIKDLSIEFPLYEGTLKALNGVSLTVKQGEIVGIVGESGSGKSITAMMTMRLLGEGSYRVRTGSIDMLGVDILKASEKEICELRGGDVAMIFQEPMTALNPTRKVGKQMVDVIRRHQRVSKGQAEEIAAGLLSDMHFADPEDILARYPFELSGGMRQRVLIALAFSCNPKVIIADEPTTALEVTVQKQVLMLLKKMAAERKTAILFITHDMAVVSQFCDRVYVMYAGSLIESGSTRKVLHSPHHPYTRGLLAALPETAAPGTQLKSIPGSVPDLSKLPVGCAFQTRCGQSSEKCHQKPALAEAPQTDAHQCACWHPLTDLEAVA